MNFLDRIRRPEDLRSLDHSGLAQLAGELRRFIIESVARTGGHLGSNLGAVELTVALHSVFDFRHDRLILDVGHQCYPHKILTGRREAFRNLRQYGGISGFPRRAESEYDAFGAGHSSTSISAACGFGLAHRLLGEPRHTVAVIGDGALTAGQALEALNHLGHLKLPLTIILNDNEMSISPNVGALSSYLSRIRTDPAYSRLKKDVEYLLRRVPMIGTTMKRFGERMKLMLKYLMVQGLLFEELGLTYMGPVDGHDIPALREAMFAARSAGKPVLLHAYTEKGKGWGPAETHRFRFHSASRFDPDNLETAPAPGRPSWTSVFGDSLIQLARQEPRIVAISAAMCEGTGLLRFSEQFPDRFFDVGICEPHAVTMAGAMACEGLIPVVAIYSTFMQRAYDQLIHDIALQELPVVFALDRAGLVGEDGPTHHGVFDLSYLRSIPGLTVLVPRDGPELRRMLAWAVSCGRPVALRYPRGDIPGPRGGASPQPLHAGEFVRLREGGELELVGVGPILQRAMEAAEILAGEGREIAVSDARFVKPLPVGLIDALRRADRPVVTLEESSICGGFGSAIAEALAGEGFARPIRRLGIPDRFVPHGSIAELLRETGLDTKGLLASIRELLPPRWPEPLPRGRRARR